MSPKAPNYQVIARKYRPQTFASVVGQEAIVTTLKNALRWNRLAHAYLFCGCRGTGKTTLARLFAKALNCLQRTDDNEPCNCCSSCLDIISSRSMDVLEIDGASNRGIDDIRQINETIGYAPASGKYKIYIIDEVHMLTKEAFNALLKTLEEPPPNVKFFFATTEPHKVLATIVSRCQRFDLNRIPTDLLAKKLYEIAQDLKIVCEEEVFSLIAQFAEGSLRDAESLLDQIICYAEPPITVSQVSATLGLIPEKIFDQLDLAFKEEKPSFAFELADLIFSSGKDVSYFLDSLLDHYRLILRTHMQTPSNIYTKKQQEHLRFCAENYTQEQCLYILDYLIQWQQQANKIPFKRLTLEMILLHIIRSKHRVSLPTLVKRLNDLTVKAAALPATTSSPPLKSPLAPLNLDTEKSPLEESLNKEEKIKESSRPDSIEQEEHLSLLKEEALQQPTTHHLELDSNPSRTQNLNQTMGSNLNQQNGNKEITGQDTEMIEPPCKIEPLPNLKTDSSDVLCLSPPTSVVDEQPAKHPEPINAMETTLIDKMKKKLSSDSMSLIQVTPQETIIQDLTKAVAEEKNDSLTTEEAIKVQARYDTLMRFASVELEGVLSKHVPKT